MAEIDLDQFDNDNLHCIVCDEAHYVAWDNNGWSSNSEAYIKLVAVAPDLLAACELFIVGFDELTKSAELDYENIIKAYEMAKAAIAKAQPNNALAAEPTD